MTTFGPVPFTETFRPMLAPQEDPISYPQFFKKLQYPLLASLKYDGIRSVTKDHRAMSRTWKPLPSYQVQLDFSHAEHSDGELIEGYAFDPDVYYRTLSHVMSESKPGDLRLFVFDYTHPNALLLPFYKRLELVEKHFKGLFGVEIVEHLEIENEDDLLQMEERALELGAEGLMLRNPVGIYKNGPRCTFNQHIIYKLKRCKTVEAKLVGLEERMHNTNAQERDERGYAKRSSSKEGKVGLNTTGKFIVFYDGKEHPVATGSFKHSELQEIWNDPKKYIGRFLMVKHFPKGAKDGLRQPRAMGWRDKMDMVKD